MNPRGTIVVSFGGLVCSGSEEEDENVKRWMVVRQKSPVEHLVQVSHEMPFNFILHPYLLSCLDTYFLFSNIYLYTEEVVTAISRLFFTLKFSESLKAIILYNIEIK